MDRLRLGALAERVHAEHNGASLVHPAMLLAGPVLLKGVQGRDARAGWRGTTRQPMHQTAPYSSSSGGWRDQYESRSAMTRTHDQDGP